jgi:hypothetical protein
VEKDLSVNQPMPHIFGYFQPVMGTLLSFVPFDDKIILLVK